MLSQINGHPLHFTILNTIMKSLLPHITQNDEWSKLITQLAKVKNLFLVVENKLSKAKEGDSKCPVCERFLFKGNLLVLVLHLQIQHEAIPTKRYFLVPEDDNELVVKKYELTYDGFEIHLVKRSNILDQSRKQTTKKSDKLPNSPVQFSFQDFLTQTQTSKYLQSSIQTRSLALLQRIFSKFTKRLQTISTQRQFYHSYNVYQPIHPDSEHSDSDREQPIEKELERLRINDFTDVSHWDKILYLEWNQLMRKEKKELKVVENVVALAQKFLRICKNKGIPKLNINIHMYTLWSVGRITSNDMLQLSIFYETLKDEQLSPAQSMA